MNTKMKILRYMNKYGAITPKEAYIHCGTMRLSARIYELRDDGYDISTQMIYRKDGTRYAQYRLEKKHERTDSDTKRA